MLWTLADNWTWDPGHGTWDMAITAHATWRNKYQNAAKEMRNKIQK